MNTMRMLRWSDKEMDAEADCRLRRWKHEGYLHETHKTYRRCPSKSRYKQAEEKVKQMAMPKDTQVVTCMAEQCVSGMVGE